MEAQKKNLPEYFYKFYRFPLDKEESIKLIESLFLKNELRVCSPYLFNDSFECLTAPWIPKDEEAVEYIKKCLKSYPLNRRLRKQIAKNKYKELGDSFFIENHIKAQEIFKKRVYISSFIGNEKNDIPLQNHLMWSHYSDSYKGFCIKVKKAELIEFHNKNTKIYHGLFFKPINYNNSGYMPIVSREEYDTEPEKVLEKTFCNKSSLWEYEREYRIFEATDNLYDNHDYNDCNYRILNNFKFSEVYLGCNIHSDIKSQIISMIRDKFTVYESNIDENKYELKFNKV